jgi:excisionase family DNA binding protein
MSSKIRLLTTKELMDKLKVKRNTIYQLRKDAELPTIKLGRTIRFDEAEIDKWLKRHQVNGGVDEWEEQEQLAG